MKNLRLGFKKYLKGMFGIFMIKLCVVGLIVINQACETEEPLIQIEARDSFLESLQLSAEKVKIVQLNKTKPQSGGDFARSLEENTLTSTVCVIDANPDLIGDYEDINTVGEVMELGGELDFTDDDTSGSSTTSTKYCFDIPVEPTEEALQPAIIEAKNYLKTKGLNDQDIASMIIEEGGKEEDLIPLVIAMTSSENSNNIAYNFSGLFFNSANAQSLGDIGQCALAAIGADIIWSLGSDGGKWTKKAIRKAFGAVAKRLLGPIGVAIAVVSFGLCVANAAIEAA